MNNSDIKLKVGRAIRKHRQLLNLSQEDLGAIVGIHRTYVSEVENGRRNIGIVNLYKIAKALKISLSELMKEAEKDGKKE